MTNDRVLISKGWLTAALALWALLAFGHGTGLDVVAAFFAWARRPGALSPAGGLAGFIRADRLLTALFALLFVAGLVAVLGRLGRRRRGDVRGWGEVIVPWGLWLLLTVLTWKVVITYSTELVHFVQYAAVATLLHRALGNRRPQLTFALGLILGCLDEVWQHYGLHVWLMGERTHYLDFSDPVLDALGLCLGLLPAVTAMHLRGDGGAESPAVARRTLAAAAILLLPILLLDPVTVSRWFGSYPWYPFWDEHTNHKAVHWVTPAEGVPFLLLSIVVLGALLDPRGRGLSPGRLTLVAACVLLAVQPPTRRAGTPVHEAVAVTVVPRTPAPVVVDGVLDDDAWGAAARLGPFVDNRAGGPDLPTCGGAPLQPTYARLLWDDAALYVGFEAADPDVWTVDGPRDFPGLDDGEGVRVFVDDGGDEVAFYEFGVSPGGVVRDLFRLVAAAPMDFNPWSQVIGLPRWDAREVRAATRVQGTLETAASSYTAVATPPDTGYTVELAIPWQVFRTTTTPTGDVARLSVPPRPGQRWRVGLYRLERPRLPRPGIDTGTLDAVQARRLLATDDEELADWMAAGTVDTTAAGALTAASIWRQRLNRCAQTQAWSPTYLDLALAARFGVIELAAEAQASR